VAPAAVRLVDLDAPCAGLWLPRSSVGTPYRSLLVVARVDGVPIGAGTFAVGHTQCLSWPELESGLRWELGNEIGAQPTRRAPEDESRHSGGRPSVSVVVTTCDQPLAVERCLRSALACDYPNFEVVVVENRPGTGATWRMLARRFPGSDRLSYIEEPRPGLSRARNAGLAAADGEIVAFTDDDTVPDPDWIHRLARRFESEPDAACVTGLILPLELETETQLLLEQFARFDKGFVRRTYRLPERRNGQPVYPYAPGAIGSGANTAIRRQVARELGGFDPTLGTGTRAMGGEDLDLYIRLILAGHAIAYEPSAIVSHRHPDGQERLTSQVYRYGVGLGAMLAKQVLAGPARVELLRAVPAGVRHATDPSSRKNSAKSADYPRRLERRERAGMLLGPFAYLASVVQNARGRRRDGRPVPTTPMLERVMLPDGRSVGVASFGGQDERTLGAPAGLRPRALERTLSGAAVAACLLAPLVVALGLPAAIRLPIVLALLSLTPGTALVAAVGGRPEPGLVVGASLACSALVAQSMLWLGAWWPEPFLYGLSAGCLALFAVAWRRPNAGRAKRSAVRTPSLKGWGHMAVVTAAGCSWVASLVGAELSEMGGTGLLGAMPATYFLAFALLLGGFAAAVSRPAPEPKILGLYTLALVLLIHGTTPLLYDEPRYTWVFTHLGVINFFAESGLTDRSVDIYNNWPGFFALNAWFSRVTGAAPVEYAEWAQVFFNLANLAALRFALRGVTGDDRVIWIATWLFLLGNWVAQDYLAPQAFGFLLAMVVVGLALRAQVRRRRPRTGAGLWLAAQVARLWALLPHGRRVPEARFASPLAPSAAILVGGLCYLAVVISHQLTPVMLLAAITGLALIDRRVPLWVPLAMALVELWWVGLAWSYVSDHYDLFDPDPASSAAPTGYVPGHGLPGLVLVAYATRFELIAFAVLALAGLVRRLRARRWDLAVAVLLVSPLLIVGLQSYGGEGRYRFYLFALPWLCFFAAAACAPPKSTGLPRSLRAWRLVLATGVLGACFLFGYFGLELSNRVRSDDVKAARWFERHAPRHSLLTGFDSTFPRRLSARYPDVYDPAFPGAPALIQRAAYRSHPLGRRDVPGIAETLRGYGNRRTFLILTSSQRRLGRLFGLFPPRSVESLDEALRASRAFRLVYEGRDASIFRLRPGTKDGPP
jgi:GT2 family glycosyltransferase